MNNFLEGLPGSVKLVAVSLIGGLAVFGGLKTGVINITGTPSPTPTATPTSSASPSVEVINVRLNLRNGETKESIPNAKTELVYLSGSTIEYTDSTGFIDIKIPKTSTTKIFISKSGYQALDRQLDPNLNIPQDRNMTLYMSPIKTESSGDKSAPETPKSTPGKGETSQSSLHDGPPSNPRARKISPEDFMRSYYQNINDRKLNDAWLMLSERRRSKQEDGFKGFQEWWGEKVDRVNVKDVKIIRDTSNSAEIEVMTSYIINQKEVDEKPLTFRLGMNSEKGSWQLLAKDE
jgi:hypothetical protein